MPDGSCQTDTFCKRPGTVLVTYRTAGVSMHGVLYPGLLVTLSVCTGHQNALAIPPGAGIVDRREIPLPAPIRPEPVGLNAVAPAAVAEEPVKLRIPRKRARRAAQ